MLSILWNYLRGYVIIEVKGFSIERFLNLTSKKGIFIWDLKETSKGAEMKISVKNFKKLKSCSKKAQCHIKIKNRFGCPFVINNMKKRHLYILGTIIFIILLYTLSSFVWLIEIHGNSRLKTKDILKFCETKGFAVGSYKNSIDAAVLKKDLKNEFPEISWISIELKGTKATIQLRETLSPINPVDISEPCNIIAKNNGIIESIITKKGTPLVKKGDVVSKGDTLVSGELLIKEDETGIIKKRTHSFADIKARLTHKISVSVPFKYTEKIYSGNEQNSYSINLFDKNITLYNPSIKYENYDSFNSLNQISVTDDYPLPIIFVKNIHKEFYYKAKKRTFEEAKKKGESLINEKIIQEFDFSTDIINKTFEYQKNENELIVTATVYVIENIGEEQKINSDEGRALIETPENADR